MNNNNSRNIYNTTGRANGSSGGNEEMEMLLGQSNASAHQMGNNHSITINNDNDMSPGISQQHLQRQQFLQQIRRDAESTRINMEANTSTENSSGEEDEDIDDRQRVINAFAMLRENNSGENVNIDDRRRVINVFAMLREARHQLNRSQSLRDHHHMPTTARNGVGENHTANTHARSWRENLCDVLSSPVTPRTEVLRAIFQSASTSSGNIRYNPLPTNDAQPEEQSHILLNRQNANQNEHELQQHSLRSHGLETQTTSSSTLRLSRQNSRLTDDRSLNDSSASSSQLPAVDSSIDNNTPVGGGVGDANRRQSNPATSNPNGGRLPQRQTSATGSTTAPTIDMVDDADTNTVGEVIVKIVNYFVHYLPFVSIIFVKFIHDHLLGILDLLLLHGVVYQINKSLKEQVAKLNQKSYAVLIRDLILLICVITYRFILSTSSPDPFGLLINPPGATISLDFTSTHKTEISKDMPTDMGLNELSDSKHSIHEVPSPPTANPLNSSTISVTKTLSLGALLYYVAVNDLILKLLTQLIKIIVTLLPIKVIRHKSRARLYALMEYISHFYRALVPMRQWLTFLFESYTGLEVISGILFSAFYLGAKGFEFVERGKSLKKALINFVRNMDYDRKPTKDELEAAGTVCPICHDSYTTPVVLECSHIFCDECVNTWFKREQTCPMCRAKVSEDRKWQDGATTYFYQLC